MGKNQVRVEEMSDIFEHFGVDSVEELEKKFGDISDSEWGNMLSEETVNRSTESICGIF